MKNTFNKIIANKKEYIQQPLYENSHPEITKEASDEIYDMVDNCPNCMLTVIRLLDVHNPYFNYREELGKFWEEKAQAELIAEQNAYYAF